MRSDFSRHTPYVLQPRSAAKVQYALVMRIDFMTVLLLQPLTVLNHICPLQGAGKERRTKIGP